eukprot:TRINITY_DN4393_c0_g1_i2.p1 TRINITY_DN4393_c0_g1~~TRINITY_DN4393_c0_g1_i2.p1  ORF type:complete len:292 (+),score=54.79 TRINITY_DN4393_c0_g1_i2:185-1060(+)
MKIPQIIIIEQLTPGHERFANDKVQKDVGVCVKKKAFPIKISTENSDFDLSKVKFTLSLLYDNTMVPVDFTEQSPLTYKTKLSKDKTNAVIEVSLLVLSSQLENSLFLIKVKAESKKDSKDFSETTSMPMKVVSKVTQLNAKAKKRTRNRSTPTKDMFINAMEKLDQGQEKHSQLLATLLEQSKQQTNILQMLLQEESQEIINTINSDIDILEHISSDITPKKKVKIEVTSEQGDDGKSSSGDNQLDFAFKSLFESFSTIEDNDFFNMADKSDFPSSNLNRSSDLFNFDDE